MTAYAIAAILVLAIGIGLWLYRRGKRDARLDAAEKTVEVKDAQIAAEHRRPAPGDIADRL